jgi:hypothetical protein
MSYKIKVVPYQVWLRIEAARILYEKPEAKKLITRTPEMLCLLCQQNPATKKESHIVPKFICKDIFNEKNEAYMIDSTNMETDPKVAQDTPKEDYILCPECERYFEQLETYVSRNPLLYLWDTSKQDGFKTHFIGTEKIIECKETVTSLFNLFLYSIMWRLFISNHSFFRKVLIHKDTVESLRKSLLEFRSESISNIKEKALATATDFLHSKYTFLTAEAFEDKTSNALCVMPGKGKPYKVMMGKYILIMSFFNNTTQESLELRNNTVPSNENIKIVVVNKDSWQDINVKFIANLTTSFPDNLLNSGHIAKKLETFMKKRKIYKEP